MLIFQISYTNTGMTEIPTNSRRRTYVNVSCHMKDRHGPSIYNVHKAGLLIKMRIVTNAVNNVKRRYQEMFICGQLSCKVG